VKVNIVEVREVPTPTQQTHEPIQWRLFTLNPVKSIEDARQIVQYYAWHWKIELLFAAAKQKKRS